MIQGGEKDYPPVRERELREDSKYLYLPGGRGEGGLSLPHSPEGGEFVSRWSGE